MWANTFGPLELAAGGTRTVTKHGVTVNAVPFHVGSDFSVFDHLKYIAISTETFDVTETGSLQFSVDITAQTPGTEAGRVIHGCYGRPASTTTSAILAHSPTRRWHDKGSRPASSSHGQLRDRATLRLVHQREHRVRVDRAAADGGHGEPGHSARSAYTQIIEEAPIKPAKTTRWPSATRAGRTRHASSTSWMASCSPPSTTWASHWTSRACRTPATAGHGGGRTAEGSPRFLRHRSRPVQLARCLPVSASRGTRSECVDPARRAALRAGCRRQLGRVPGNDQDLLIKEHALSFCLASLADGR